MKKVQPVQKILPDGRAVLQKLEEQKTAAVDHLLIGMTVLALIGVPFSVSRAFYTGWTQTYTLHIFLLIVVLGFSLFRSSFTLEQKVWAILSMGILVSVSGLFTYGLVGNGLLWGMYTVLVSIFFLKRNVAYITTVIIFTAYGIVAFQFIYGEKSFPGGADVYLTQASSWGTALLGSAMFIVLIVSLSAGLRRQQDELLLELEHKNVEISRLANFDDLTGLPVLRQLKKEAERALLQRNRESRFIALCFLDLDGFKTVNDRFGHDAGDFILQSVAQRLLSHIRQVDIATRVGGDEFVILLNSDTKIDLDVFCTRLLKKIREPYFYEGEELNIGASIGVSSVNSEGMSVEELMKKADEAMYEVKRRGKNDYLVTCVSESVAKS